MNAGLRAVAAAAAIVIVALLTFIPVSNGDFWLHAAIGRIVWTSGEIPRTLLFPFTEASAFPVRPQEWLASVALYLLDRGLGSDRLVFASGAIGLAVFALAWRLAFRLTKAFFASLALALAFMAAVNYRHYLSPELLALLFSLALLSLLVEYRSSGKWRYLLACAPLALVWANCHGSFPLALVIAACFAAGAALEARAARAALPYLACSALMAVAMSVNPEGPWAFQSIATEQAWRGSSSFIAVVALFALSVALAPFAARLDRAKAAQGVLLVVLAACAALLVRLGNVNGAYPYFVVSNRFSPALLDYVEARRFEGGVLNSPALGDELAYRFYPRLRPAIDSRLDAYGSDYAGRVLKAQGEEAAFRQFTGRYGVRHVLLPWSEFQQGLARSPGLQADGWRIVFADHKMVMLERP